MRLLINLTDAFEKNGAPNFPFEVAVWVVVGVGVGVGVVITEFRVEDLFFIQLPDESLDHPLR